MNFSDEDLAELCTVCPGAVPMDEGGITYVYLPSLKLPTGRTPSEVEGLLRPQGATNVDGYSTRLYLSMPFSECGQNWTQHRILDKQWHTLSFNGVPETLRLVEILANHLEVLR